MTLFIPVFWCGVIATIIAEVVLLVVIGIKKKIDDKRNMKLRRK